jgi:hypothetical protein
MPGRRFKAYELMAVFTNPIVLYRKQKKFFDMFPRSMREMHKVIVAEGRNDALELTSGNVKTRELIKMGHPFARRIVIFQNGKKFAGRQRGTLPVLPINVQTGVLRRSLSIKTLWRNIRGESYGMFFGAPYAKYILAKSGTSKMVARLFQAEIKKRWMARKKAFIQHMRDLAKAA